MKWSNFIIFLFVDFVLSLWLAQVTVFGLSLYHINSGIWGPYLLICVLGSVIALGVMAGTRDD